MPRDPLAPLTADDLGAWPTRWQVVESKRAYVIGSVERVKGGYHAWTRARGRLGRSPSYAEAVALVLAAENARRAALREAVTDA